MCNKIQELEALTMMDVMLLHPYIKFDAEYVKNHWAQGENAEFVLSFKEIAEVTILVTDIYEVHGREDDKAEIVLRNGDKFGVKHSHDYVVGKIAQAFGWGKK